MPTINAINPAHPVYPLYPVQNAPQPQTLVYDYSPPDVYFVDSTPNLSKLGVQESSSANKLRQLAKRFAESAPE